jgi:hemin uptake protein HemP
MFHTTSAHAPMSPVFSTISELQPLSGSYRCNTSDAPPLASESLLKGHKIVEIVHNGNLYKLQATKLGKLILTK